MNAKNKLPDFLKEQLKTIDGLTKRNNQLSQDFEIEKNCKNQAYFFILQNGYFDEYLEYTKDNPVEPVQAR
jgi:AAA15 family ATPase/GTPase